MQDTGWRRNKYGGWFNINDIGKNKPQRYTVIHKTKIGEEVGENYGTLEEGIDYYQKFFGNSKAYELQDEKGNKIDVNKYMNDKIRREGKKEKDKAYQLTDDNLQQIINESISEWDDHYAQLYISKISPDDFLELTTDYNMYGYIKDEAKELDLAKVQGTKYVADMMYLDVDLETGLVNGHEGRHRMMALKNAGYKQVDIVVWPRNYDKYNAKEYANKKITAQEGTGFSSKYKDFSTELKQLVPVSKANVDRIKKRDY